MKNDLLVNYFIFTTDKLNEVMEGITHETSLVRPSPKGNNINWLLGHLVITRDNMTKVLCSQNICGEETTALYREGTPVTTAATAKNTIELLKIFNDNNELLMNGLQKLDLSDNPDREKRIAYLAFHEAYHTGQIGILRRQIEDLVD